MTYLLFVVGLVLLIVGAEVLVRGASRLAQAFGITPLVVGLTVVAFGTSSPELTVSVMSVLEGEGAVAIALGNVVGSNIFNVLFILGAAALIVPLGVGQKLVRTDVPIMIGLSVFVLLLALDGVVGRWEGVLLFAGMLAYIVLAVRQGRTVPVAVGEEYEEEFGEEEPGRRTWLDVVYVLVGLGMLVVGSRWLVDGAVTMARSFGVSELVISLTIVSAGTSLPEVATSVLASVRGERDIAVGNVVGSNIFNLLAVLGLTAIVAPDGLAVPPAALNFDIPVMIAAASLCLPIFFTGHRIGRVEAFLLLAYYAAYVGYLILAANQHDALPAFSSAILYVVAPATVLYLLVEVVRQRRGDI